MGDILVRDLPEETLAAINAAATKEGLSRAEWIRRTLEAHVGIQHVRVEDLQGFAELASDLNDPAVMAGAWS